MLYLVIWTEKTKKAASFPSLLQYFADIYILLESKMLFLLASKFPQAYKKAVPSCTFIVKASKSIKMHILSTQQKPT